ncbi:MAG: hypothetical protein Q7R58_01195 [bacterium]|nr:hypothetical protein [bacterium]
MKTEDKRSRALMCFAAVMALVVSTAIFLTIVIVSIWSEDEGSGANQEQVALFNELREVPVGALVIADGDLVYRKLPDNEGLCGDKFIALGHVRTGLTCLDTNSVGLKIRVVREDDASYEMIEETFRMGWKYPFNRNL